MYIEKLGKTNLNYLSFRCFGRMFNFDGNQLMNTFGLKKMNNIGLSYLFSNS